MVNISVRFYCDDFIAALREFGIDNVDYYNAITKDPDNGQVYDNYKAANIIGAFESVKELAEQGLDMARFDVYILVSERLKTFLVSKGYTKIDFMELGSIAIGVAD